MRKVQKEKGNGCIVEELNDEQMPVLVSEISVFGFNCHFLPVAMRFLSLLYQHAVFFPPVPLFVYKFVFRKLGY